MQHGVTAWRHDENGNGDGLVVNNDNNQQASTLVFDSIMAQAYPASTMFNVIIFCGQQWRQYNINASPSGNGSIYLSMLCSQRDIHRIKIFNIMAATAAVAKTLSYCVCNNNYSEQPGVAW